MLLSSMGPRRSPWDRGDRPGVGCKPRLTEAKGSQIVARAKGPTPRAILRRSEGTLATAAPDAEANWTRRQTLGPGRPRGAFSR